MEADDDLPKRIAEYSHREPNAVIAGVRSVFAWAEKSRRRDKLDVARFEIERIIVTLEERVLDRFRDFAGGPDYIHKDNAWISACRQREFVREACARLAELPGGIPTMLSEEIRAIDIGPDVKVIPDYSKKVQQDGF
ncbi:hypothetical protein [Rhizobium leucaenae]|uniref:hypothetical protein n=1 Tax=Rhizobium leucaenae TaxID=29450 RepID=UPI0007EE854D|nr:hypothetical protein [Rhizobium leucaenae]